MKDKIIKSLDNCIYDGEVFHSRKKTKSHSFKYRVFYLNLNIMEIKNKFKNIPILSINKFNLFSFYYKDYGPKDTPDLVKWILKLLKNNNFKSKVKDIFLLTHPRILGYVFNPLSIYTCTDLNNKIIAQIYEVHNTFGQRHFYLIKNSFDQNNHSKKVKKCFHVSPFFDLSGHYNFKSYLKDDSISIMIDYKSKNNVFLASFKGIKKELNNKTLIKYLLRKPFMTLKVILGIHFEALFLFFKGIKFFKCPPLKKNNITTDTQGEA